VVPRPCNYRASSCRDFCSLVSVPLNFFFFRFPYSILSSLFFFNPNIKNKLKKKNSFCLRLGEVGFFSSVYSVAGLMICSQIYTRRASDNFISSSSTSTAYLLVPRTQPSVVVLHANVGGSVDDHDAIAKVVRANRMAALAIDNTLEAKERHSLATLRIQLERRVVWFARLGVVRDGREGSHRGIAGATNEDCTRDPFKKENFF